MKLKMKETCIANSSNRVYQEGINFQSATLPQDEDASVFLVRKII